MGLYVSDQVGLHLTAPSLLSLHRWGGVERCEVFPAGSTVANTCQIPPCGHLWLFEECVRHGGSPGMELQRVTGGDRETERQTCSCPLSSVAQPLPALQREIPHPHRSLWAKTREGEASETGSVHPPTPARTPHHLPPTTPNSSLGQGLAPASRDPERAPGPALPRCASQASSPASQGPSWAGPRQVPQRWSQQDFVAWGAGAEQGPPTLYHPLPAPLPASRCCAWPGPAGMRLSSFSSPAAALLLRLAQCC